MKLIFLNYRVFPKYYSKIPPFIKWSGVKDLITTKKWEDIPDYLLAYQSYLKSKDEFLISKGLKSPDELNKGLYTGVFDKMAHSLDVNIQKAQQARYKINGNFTPPLSVVYFFFNYFIVLIYLLFKLFYDFNEKYNLYR